MADKAVYVEGKTRGVLTDCESKTSQTGKPYTSIKVGSEQFSIWSPEVAGQAKSSEGLEVEVYWKSKEGSKFKQAEEIILMQPKEHAGSQDWTTAPPQPRSGDLISSDQIMSLNETIRLKALECAARLCVGSVSAADADKVIAVAREFEQYIIGDGL